MLQAFKPYLCPFNPYASSVPFVGYYSNFEEHAPAALVAIFRHFGVFVDEDVLRKEVITSSGHCSGDEMARWLDHYDLYVRRQSRTSAEDIRQKLLKGKLALVKREEWHDWGVIYGYDLKQGQAYCMFPNAPDMQIMPYPEVWKHCGPAALFCAQRS